jgi:hypothetical protein
MKVGDRVRFNCETGFDAERCNGKEGTVVPGEAWPDGQALNVQFDDPEIGTCYCMTYALEHLPS